MSIIYLEKCNNTCLRVTLPQELYPICPDYDIWYNNILKEHIMAAEADCSWGIVKDLIEEITTNEDNAKTCITTEYSGQIIQENDEFGSNELAIQYKFTFPLKTKVSQEYIITDTIGVIGSVGGTLGLFIGFDFTNLSFLIGLIGVYLTCSKKFTANVRKCLDWIIYAALVAISIWFTWEVFDTFANQAKGIWQYEQKLQSQPTVSLCMHPFWEYETTVNITYITYHNDGYSYEDETILKIGENNLDTSKEIVNLTKLYTRFNGVCYTINTARKVDERNTQIKIHSDSYNLPNFTMYFTSEKNAYGVTNRDWRDGKSYSYYSSGGNRKVEIDFTVDRHVYLECNKDGFYEYIGKKLSKQSFANCSEICLQTSLPNDPFPMCPYYTTWYNTDQRNISEKESDCNWRVVADLIQQSMAMDEHMETCNTTEYSGQITVDEERPLETSTYIRYKFSLPLKAKVYQEYLIIDTFGLIGSVGGTLGLFIGFTFAGITEQAIHKFRQLLTKS